MTLTDIDIKGYRSVRKLRLPLRQLTVLIGGNGVGKTNLYRSIELLSATAKGTLADEIATEGGLGSIHFAGQLKAHERPILSLGVTLEGILDAPAPMIYTVDVGFPMQADGRVISAAFLTEAQIKSERLAVRQRGKETELMERRGPATWVRDHTGKRVAESNELLASETALSSLRGGYPEIDAVRHVMTNWRFYHGFRTDAQSPLRRPSPAITAPTLSSDGGNLAEVFATLRHIREETFDLDAAVEAAFPGASLQVPRPDTAATFGLVFPETPKRTFWAHELSDGTLQFMALMGALLSYRLPPFIALNEPETSLHPSLLPALAKTIVKAAERAQIWVVTHSQPLADAIAAESGVVAREVIRDEDGTAIRGLSPLGVFDDE
jgi:predicted ATPase